MDKLPDDLLVQILSRVPGKTAVRCKSISKRFLGLMSRHIKQYIYYRHILFQQQMQEEENENDWHLYNVFKHMAIVFFSTRFFDLKFDLKLDGEIWNCLTSSRIIGCYNDLFLCKCDSYYVCNPIIKWWMKIPNIPWCYIDYVSEGFVCEPYYKVEGNAVTFNPRHRFRIVRVGRLDGRPKLRHEFEVVIFSSETGQWISKQVSGLNGSFKANYGWSAVAHEGRLYFKGEYNVMMYDPFNNPGQYHTIDYPKHSDEIYFDIGVCCGKIRISNLEDPEVIRVWELEQNFSWRLLHHTLLPIPEGQSIFGMPQVKFFHAHHGDIVFFRDVYHTFQANLKTKKVQIVANTDRLFPFQLVSIDLPLWLTPPPSII